MSEHVSKFEILKQFTMQNPEQVEAYLTEYSVLEAVLAEAYEQIQSQFANPEIELKLVQDYEIPDDKTLYLYIYSDMEMTIVWDLLRQIEDNWYLKLPRFIREIFNIDAR